MVLYILKIVKQNSLQNIFENEIILEFILKMNELQLNFLPKEKDIEELFMNIYVNIKMIFFLRRKKENTLGL